MKLVRQSRTCQTSPKLYWTSWLFWRLLEIIKNILKLARQSRTCQTSLKFYCTFWQSWRLLKIIEKYFEAYKTFQDLQNFTKVILDLLAILETFRNPSGKPGDFKKIIKIILVLARCSRTCQKIFCSFQEIQGFVKLLENYF